MNPKHWRPVRVARTALAISRVLPRYAALVFPERVGGRTAPQDAWDRVHRRAAQEFRALALSLAGAFTKAAQIWGARADVFPKPFIDILSQFHDAVPPRPFEGLREAVERDLGGSVGEVFASFETEAFAAASLAQVHRATLPDGTRVVVKVRYPEVPRLIPTDMRMLRVVAKLAHAMQPGLDLRSIVTEIARFIELEIDFQREVASMQRLGRILEAWPDVVVPRVFPELCGTQTIVMERIDGIQVTHRDALVAAGHRLPDIARKIGALYGGMIFETGFFHGDPHPGNLLVLPDGRIGLLDYGLCKELPKDFARQTAQMMVCGLIGDADAALEAAGHLGFEIESLSADQLRSLFLFAVGDSDGEAGVLDVLGGTRVTKIPEDFALVIRTMVLLNGLSERLVPGRRLVQAELVKHLAAGAASA